MAGPKIALLLSDAPSDLAASITAVQLAERTEGYLYILQRRGTDGKPLDDHRFVARFAALEGVESHCHLLTEGTIEELANFLLVNAVTWLVVGGWPEESRAQREEWLGRLSERLRQAPKRFCPELRTIVAPPMTEEDLERIINQSRRLTQLAAGKDRKKPPGP